MNNQRLIVSTIQRNLQTSIKQSRRSFFNESSTHRIKPEINHIFERARDNANNFDNHYNFKHTALKVNQTTKSFRSPMRPCLDVNQKNVKAHVPNYIPRPPYALNGGIPPSSPNHVVIQDKAGIDALRKSARLARKVLDKTCALARPGISTDEINTLVHQFIIEEGAYPSPLNYAGFPKSVCTSVNEVVCHGIPDGYILKKGDVASFDVSLFYDGFHGDNCATVLVGPEDEALDFESKDEEMVFINGQRLILACQEALDMAISTCSNGSCLTEVGSAISAVSEAYGYDSVKKYRGHGIGRDFHCPPFVKHYRNDDYLELKEGMVFTIEPMLTEGHGDCVEWESDNWTVVTLDGGLSAQFEHMVAITSDGVEILTCPE